MSGRVVAIDTQTEDVYTGEKYTVLETQTKYKITAGLSLPPLASMVAGSIHNGYGKDYPPPTCGQFKIVNIQGGSDKSGIFFFLLSNDTAKLKIIRID
jgi:hypothetical protein